MANPIYLSRALEEINVPLHARRFFYTFLNKVNIINEDKSPTQIAHDIGLVTTKAIIPPYYSWNVYFIMDKLNEYGFSTDSRFTAARSEYSDVYFTKKQLRSNNLMCEPLTTQEIDTILEPYTDDDGKPTNEILEQNIAKIVPGYPIYSWDIGSVQKTYDFHINNKKNTNLQDLIHYMNNNH